MSENENKVCPVSCKIEHHAMMFAFLAKHAIELCGEAGKDAILAGMTTYGNERGARMAANALAHGDELTTMTNQAYGEWKPDYAGQMDFGTLRTEPTLQTYIAKCAWCEAWKKHNITEYGKYYCVNVDNAVYQGFRSDFVCTPTATSMSWGGKRCEFDWGHPLSQEEVPGYLILFDTHAFELQRQLRYSRLPSQSEFFVISKHFTATRRIPVFGW